MEFDKHNMGVLRQKLQAVLNDFAKQHGIDSMSMGIIRFDSESARFKVECEKNASKPGLTKMLLPTFGGSIITPGSIFRQAHTEYTVIATGLKGKFPISVKTQNGKSYKTKPEHLLNMERVK